MAVQGGPMVLFLSYAVLLITILSFTHCEVPERNRLNLVKIPEGAAELREESITYEAVPGTQGMFDDVAREINARMRRILTDRSYVVVFEFGGIGAKYYSIIDRLTSSGPDVPTVHDKAATQPLGESERPSDSGKPEASAATTIRTKEGYRHPSRSGGDGYVDGQRSLRLEYTTKPPPAVSESPVKYISHTANEKPVDLIPENTIKAPLLSDLVATTLSPITDEPIHFITPSNASVNAADAHALSVGLKPVTAQFSITIKSKGFNCVRIEPTTVNVNLYVVDNVAFGEGQICGLESMQPGNNAVITKEDEETIQVSVPLLLKDLTVKIKSINVNGYFFALIKDQPLEATVKEISCNGTLSFKKGTFELVSLRIEWRDISGVHIKMEGSALSGVVDYLAGALSGVIKLFISPVLDQIEKQITKSIIGH